MTDSRARASALGEATARLNSIPLEVPTAVVAVSSEQWVRSVLEADIEGAFTAYQSARAKSAATEDRHGSGLNRRLRPATIELAAATATVAARLELLAVLSPASVDTQITVLDLRTALIEDARTVVNAAITDTDVAPLISLAPLPHGVPDDRDVLLDTFGFTREQLADEAGMFSDTRLIAAYRLRLDRLQVICDRVLGLVAEDPPSVFSAAAVARDLVSSVSPVLTLSAAREIRARIITSFERDGPRTARVLARSLDEQDHELTSFSRMSDRLRRAHTASTERHKAVSLLEAYKHMAEGHTRRWVGVLLQLAGMNGDPPSVGQLAEPAAARLGWLGAYVNSVLLPVVRNAEAHEEVDFDEDTGCLLAAGESIDVDELSHCLTTLDVLQRGWMIGKVCALSDRPDLVRAMHERSRVRSRSSALLFARQRFAHAGQPVREFTRNRDRLDILLDEIRPAASNPCFLALTQSAQVLSGVARFIVSVPGRDAPVIDVPSSVLSVNFPVFHLAARTLRQLPTATFLPCLAWCRLEHESLAEAFRATAWLTLNDVQHALDELSSFNRQECLSQLQVAQAAAAATLYVLPRSPERHLIERAIAVTNRVTNAVSRGKAGPAFEIVLGRVMTERDCLGPGPPILPTLDRTSIEDYPPTNEVI